MCDKYRMTGIWSNHSSFLRPWTGHTFLVHTGQSIIQSIIQSINTSIISFCIPFCMLFFFERKFILFPGCDSRNFVLVWNQYVVVPGIQFFPGQKEDPLPTPGPHTQLLRQWDSEPHRLHDACPTFKRYLWPVSIVLDEVGYVYTYIYFTCTRTATLHVHVQLHYMCMYSYLTCARTAILHVYV